MSEKPDPLAMIAAALTSLAESSKINAEAIQRLAPPRRPESANEGHEMVRKNIYGQDRAMAPVRRRTVQSPHTNAIFTVVESLRGAELAEGTPRTKGAIQAQDHFGNDMKDLFWYGGEWKVTNIEEYRFPEGHDKHQRSGGLVPDGFEMKDYASGKESGAYKLWRTHSFWLVDAKAFVGKKLPAFVNEVAVN